MTAQQKQKIERWWQSYGFLVKGGGKLLWLSIMGIVSGVFTAGSLVNEFKHQWRDRGQADMRHDSVDRTHTAQIKSLDSLQLLYVRREELKPSAFRNPLD